MIEFNQIYKKYGDNFAFEDLNLSLESDKVTVLIGSSGSGKSTLLKLILGLVKPASGNIKIKNLILSADNVNEIRQKMGYVIQSGGLFPHLTAKQNIILMAEYLNKKQEWINTRLNELVDLTHFPSDGLNRYPKELSGDNNKE